MLRAEPNPVSGDLTVSWDAGGEGDVAIDLFGVDGGLVARLIDGAQTGGVHRSRFDLRGIAPGAYILRMESAGRVVAEPIVKRE